MSLSPALLKKIESRILLNPFLFFLMREIHRFSKVLFQTIFIPIMNSSLYLVIFGVSLGSRLQWMENLSYLEFIIPGLVVMGCITNTFQNGSSSILSLKFGGDIVDVRVSPLTNSQMVWAFALGGVCRGFLVSAIVFIIGNIFHFYYMDEWLWPHSTVNTLFFLSLSGLAFNKLGVIAAFLSKTIDHIGAIGGIILTPLIYLGGVFFSLDMLSPFWRTVSFFNPMLYFINGIRYGILGQSDVPINLCVTVCLTSLVVFHILCILTMKKSDNYRRW